MLRPTSHPRGMRWPIRFIKMFAGLNAVVYRMSGGRVMGKMGASDICVVRMQGARSGKWRDVPLMYVPNGDGVILVASLGGAPKNPVWYYNLVAHPDIEVQVKQNTLKLRARLASRGGKGRGVAALRRGLSAVRGVSEADDARHPGLHLRPEVRTEVPRSTESRCCPGCCRCGMLTAAHCVRRARKRNRSRLRHSSRRRPHGKPPARR